MTYQYMLTQAKTGGIHYVLIVVLLSLAVLTGCADWCPEKSISKDYYLKRSESDEYYLQRKGHEVEGVGLVEGTVQQAGWSGTTILVLRRACFRGDPDGWMVIDTKTHAIAGPISDTEKREKFKAIVCYPVQEAWNKPSLL